MKIAFLGLGRMGSGMAQNLLRAGHELVVYNRTPERMQPLVAQGAKPAASPAEAVQGVDALVTMLADDAAVETVLFGANGAFAALPAGAIHVSSSTLSEAFVVRLAEEHARAGHGFVSAPVFGRPEAAAAGKLRVVVAGTPQFVECARPIFEAIGEAVHVVGTQPQLANVVKLAGNFMIMALLEALGESYALMRKAGIEPLQFLEIINGLFRSPVYENYGRIVAEERFSPAGFAAKLGLKDMRFVLASAERAAAPMPLASLVRDRFLALMAQGGESLDWAALTRIAAMEAGLGAAAKGDTP
ncbi:6-phosphogluconate dehydrogenase [Tepidiphilus sp. HLB4]